MKSHQLTGDAVAQWKLIIQQGNWSEEDVLGAVRDLGNNAEKHDLSAAADYWEQMLLACAAPEEEPTLAGLAMKKGDLVKVTDGAFESYEGEVDSVDERRGMVTVIVAIFGRSTPVEVGYWQLEKAEE